MFKTCPFCQNENSNFIKTILSSINNKKYDHYFCNICDLEFFTPLLFEDIYQNNKISEYQNFHEGTRDMPVWSKNLKDILVKENLVKNISNKTILDVGGGDGINYLLLKDTIKKGNYHIIDLNKKSLKIAQKRGIINLYNDFYDLDFCNKIKRKFDFIIATEVLEHMVNPKLFFDISFNLLKKNGLLIISVPNKNRFLFRYKIGTDIPPHHFLRFGKVFFKKNFKNVKIYNSFDKNTNINISAKAISKTIFGFESLWLLCSLFIPILRIMDRIRGDGIIVIISNKSLSNNYNHFIS